MSLPSKLIRWFTRSKWSHAAIQLSDGIVYEAWKGRVRKQRSFREDHTPGTKVDFFEIEIVGQKACLVYLEKARGQRYDWMSIIRFVTRAGSLDNPEICICSELVFSALMAGGVCPLARILPHHVSPQLLGISPYLHYHHTETV